jgi:hypothetical protein
MRLTCRGEVGGVSFEVFTVFCNLATGVITAGSKVEGLYWMLAGTTKIHRVHIFMFFAPDVCEMSTLFPSSICPHVACPRRCQQKLIWFIIGPI